MKLKFPFKKGATRVQHWCKEKERGCGPKKKSKELGTFYDGQSLTVKLDLCRRSAGRQ